MSGFPRPGNLQVTPPLARVRTPWRGPERHTSVTAAPRLTALLLVPAPATSAASSGTDRRAVSQPRAPIREPGTPSARRGRATRASLRAARRAEAREDELRAGRSRSRTGRTHDQKLADHACHGGLVQVLGLVDEAAACRTAAAGPPTVTPCRQAVSQVSGPSPAVGMGIGRTAPSSRETDAAVLYSWLRSPARTSISKQRPPPEPTRETGAVFFMAGLRIERRGTAL